MKNMKKLLAVLVAVLMVAISMSALAADEVPEGLTADTTITISSLDDGDTVNLYKVIEWDQGTAGSDTVASRRAGWVLTSDFAEDNACKEVLRKINAKTDGVYSLTEDDVKAFTDVIKNGSIAKTPSGTVTNGTSTTTVEPGMYVALVKPIKPDTMYNPIVVSADYNSSNKTNIMGSDVPLSQAMVGNATATAKKETTKVEKEQSDASGAAACDYKVGDTVTFTVKTTIPSFADAYLAPTFKVTDKMSDGLAYTDGTIKVKDGNGVDIASGNYTFSKTNAQNWTVDFDSDYVKSLEAPQAIVITYDAVITEDVFTSVNEETNDVEIEFSNNPDKDSDKGKVKDKTRSYTFSIDGSLLGGGGDQTSELIKVAVDGNGDPIMQSTASGKTYQNALAGATFGLYTDKTAADNETDAYYTNASFQGTVTTDADGYMEINGLDVGTYYLKELTAPAGFIRDQKTHEIVISATYGTETVPATDEYPAYTVPVLESYTITIDGTNTSTYNMKLSENKEITTSEATNPPTSIANTKGVELPSTGGMGTTLFYIGGAVLVLGAVVVMITRRRVRG